MRRCRNARCKQRSVELKEANTWKGVERSMQFSEAKQTKFLGRSSDEDLREMMILEITVLRVQKDELIEKRTIRRIASYAKISNRLWSSKLGVQISNFVSFEFEIYKRPPTMNLNEKINVINWRAVLPSLNENTNCWQIASVQATKRSSRRFIFVAEVSACWSSKFWNETVRNRKISGVWWQRGTAERSLYNCWEIFNENSQKSYRFLQSSANCCLECFVLRMLLAITGNFESFGNTLNSERPKNDALFETF